MARNTDWVDIAIGILGAIWIVAALGAFMSLVFPSPRDDTDPANGRSSLTVLTDCLTGRQYLTTQRGGVYPRLDSEGRQIIKQCED